MMVSESGSALDRDRYELLRPGRNPPRRLDLAQQARLEETARRNSWSARSASVSGGSPGASASRLVQFPPQLPHLLQRQRTDAAQELIQLF